MRKVILNLALSLDGYIEGPDGGYEWCFTDQDYGITEFLSTVDTIFLGRKSYELLIGAEENPFPGFKKYVFTDTLPPLKHEEIEMVPQADFEQTVKALIQEPGGDIWLFGGASLFTSFMNAGLVSHYILSIHPVILGGGKPLFQNLQHRTELLHLDTVTHPNGLVQLKYSFKPEFNYELLNDKYKRSGMLD